MIDINLVTNPEGELLLSGVSLRLKESVGGETLKVLRTDVTDAHVELMRQNIEDSVISKN